MDDRGVAEDITQDVLARSLAAGAFDTVDSPSAWLYRAARNAVIDHYRLRKRHDTLADAERWPDPERGDDLPNLATRELAGCLRPLAARLAPTYRDALTRVDLDGQTHQQAAAAVGISVSGMKSRVQRARRQLRDLLTECCEVHTDSTGSIHSYHAEQRRCASNCR